MRYRLYAVVEMSDRISVLGLIIKKNDNSRNGGLNMRWILIIILAIAVEFFARFLTRKMEDKKKREKLLALIWFGFGAVLVVIWVINRFL
ncbi:hypothetical protein GGGNBK_00505 [Sporosarcina sp. ANT_H38]